MSRVRFDKKAAMARMDELEYIVPLQHVASPQVALSTVPPTVTSKDAIGTTSQGTPASEPDTKSAEPKGPLTEASSPSIETLNESVQEMEDRKIPYKRFKEVNDQMKALKNELERKEKESAIFAKEKELILAQEKLKLREELSKKASDADLWDGLDPVEAVDDPVSRQFNELRSVIDKQGQTIQALLGQTKTQELNQRLVELKEVHPHMDEEAVLGWKKVMPEKTLDELAELSHTRNEGMIKNYVQSLLNKKKTQTQTITTETKEAQAPGLGLQRPKNMKEASRMFRQAAKGIQW